MEVVKLGRTIKFKYGIVPEHAVMYGDEIIYRGSEAQCYRYIKFKYGIVPEHAVMYGDEIIYRGSEAQCYRYVYYMSGSSEAMIKDHPSYKKEEME